MKSLFRRFYYCWLRDQHWTMTFHGYWPSRWAHCSGCGKLLMEPHEVESLDIKPKTINEGRAERGLSPIRLGL